MAQYRIDSNLFLPNGNTIYEVVMIADQYGNMVGPSNPSGMAVDGFGRARTSMPLTLFDSFSKYNDNGKFSTSNTATATYSFSSNSAATSMNVDTTSGAKVVKESNRVFAYQPGKSLQLFNTFVMNESKENLRQRIGYFNDKNGIFLEQNGTDIRFVVRSNVSGVPTDSIAEKADWNLDKLDGNGPSHLELNLTKAQIFFTDIEWLGVGTVRCGFVINGQLIHCHSFHHANSIESVYMSTACLPIRYEIENIGTTSTNSSLKQICSSVISEGGYEIRGKKRTIGQAVNTLYDLTTAETFYPVVSVKLRSGYEDAIAVVKNLSLLGVGNNTRLCYKLVAGGTTTGGAWANASSTSAVQYNLTGTSFSGGRDMVRGYVGVNNQSGQTINLDSEMFGYQLERNGLTGVTTEITLVVSGAANGDDCLCSIEWDEIT